MIRIASDLESYDTGTATCEQYSSRLHWNRIEDESWSDSHKDRWGGEIYLMAGKK